jgi:hypothetical protein
MAKMVLRGVNFSCSLIVLAMLSTVLTIFHATKAIPARNNLPAWAPKTAVWPQIVVLSIACTSLLFAVIVMAAYCRGGHKRAEKVAVYYTMFAVGWFVVSVVMWLVGAGILHGSKANGNGKDLWGWSCKDNKRRQLFQDDVHYALVCRLQDWSLICCVIEVIVELIVIAIYGVVFYRFWSKNRLRKSMDARDRARTDLYLAQLRSQSAPNTPGFAQTPRTAGFPNATTPRTPGFPTMNKEKVSDDDGMQYISATPKSTHTQSAFKLQAPPIKVHHATPRSPQDGFEPVTSSSPPPPSMSPPPQERRNEHVDAAPGEQTYDAVPIPGAYATTVPQQHGQAY